MPTATATVQVAEDGRVTIPLEVRKKLGIAGTDAFAEIEVRVDE